MGILNASLNLIFDVVFVKAPLPFGGLRGLALSTSLTHLIVAVVFYFRLENVLRASPATSARAPMESQA
jgi:peptidoglycan biosynthesis protein MviN/MurJ (putative lipid II flippase)